LKHANLSIFIGLSHVKDGNKLRENAVYGIAHIYALNKDTTKLVGMLDRIEPFFNSLPRARTAKIVRSMLERVAQVPESLDMQVELCEGAVKWCSEKKRTFLRQRLQARLVDLWLKQKRFGDALELIKTLVLEVKKVDDKALLVDIHLTESRVHHALRNIPKSKAALTAARTNSNAIYVTPVLQAQIDLMAGQLNCEEKDFTTAYSYFFEAFEAFDGLKGGDDRALLTLKYMILSRIMNGAAQDVAQILSGKHGIKYSGESLNALKAISDAYKARSLEQFEEVRATFRNEFESNSLIHRNLEDLYETMLEQNLVRIIEPYSRVELSHVAKLIKLPEVRVVQKLSQMILDNKFSGTLDQGQGHLLVFEAPPSDDSYTHSIHVLKRMDSAVGSLLVQAEAAAKTLA
jgi:26S proteasome regulatory subunit N6